jgi:hypothetical protein
MIGMLYKFAEAHAWFGGLGLSDQHILLDHNAPLFVQGSILCFGRKVFGQISILQFRTNFYPLISDKFLCFNFGQIFIRKHQTNVYLIILDQIHRLYRHPHYIPFDHFNCCPLISAETFSYIHSTPVHPGQILRLRVWRGANDVALPAPVRRSDEEQRIGS